MSVKPVGRGFAEQQELTSAKGPSVPANTISDIWNGDASCHIVASTKYSSVSMTIASPCVVTYPASSGALANNEIVFATTGTLPTGIVAGTTYYILAPTGATSNIAATPGGTAINTSGSQSGTQSARYNVPITSLGVAPYEGATATVIFDSKFSLVHSANLNLPGSANITTAAGDSCVVYADTKTQFDILSYQKASGKATVPALTSGTVIATTSGTTVDFTGIPAGVVKITIGLIEVTYNTGTPPYTLQIGDSGGLEATGYVASTTRLTDATAIATTSGTTSFALTDAAVAGEPLSGVWILSLVDAATNTWAFSGSGKRNTTTICVSAGSKSLTGTLDRLTLTVGGSTFTGGKVNILYE